MSVRRTLFVVIALLVTVTVVLQAPSAEAAPYKTHHSGVIVATPRQLLTHNGAKAAVKPVIWIGPGRRRQVLDYVTLAYQNRRRVARGHTVYLRPGFYGLAVRVKYRNWWYRANGSKAYSAPIRFTTPRHGLLIVNRSQPAPPHHACTLTSTGHCIEGGEFCPQASYGMTGYDAAGRAWVCTGDQTHPHWE